MQTLFINARTKRRRRYSLVAWGVNPRMDSAQGNNRGAGVVCAKAHPLPPRNPNARQKGKDIF